MLYLMRLQDPSLSRMRTRRLYYFLCLDQFSGHIWGANWKSAGIQRDGRRETDSVSQCFAACTCRRAIFCRAYSQRGIRFFSTKRVDQYLMLLEAYTRDIGTPSYRENKVVTLFILLTR